MPLPPPEPGLGICYSYLWLHEHNAGLEEGRKVRPAVIVFSAVTPKNGNTRVMDAPVTHSAPKSGTIAIEIPPKVKAHLGLDAERSWIVLDEVNAFDWPGSDIYPFAGSKSNFAYGFIPPKLYELVKQTLLKANRLKQTQLNKRD